MTREDFITYFEVHFFSKKSQDLIGNQYAMMQSLGDSPFVENILHGTGRAEISEFLRQEYKKDGWENLVEFFVENGIIMMDVAGYSDFLDNTRLFEFERLYKDLVCDIYETVRSESCCLEDLKLLLQAHIDRLLLYFGVYEAEKIS